MDTLYILIAVVSIAITLSAQAGVKSAFNKYSKVTAKRNVTGSQVAKRILEQNNINYVFVEQTQGNLTDHFSPKESKIRLSEGVYDSNSIAAIGVAAHECGHAIQYDNGYFPIQVRNFIIPITQIGATISPYLILAGVILNFAMLIDIALILFGAVVLFQLITLPVEFNASKRALESLSQTYVLDEYELKGAKRVLNAAAMTYVAALVVSIMQLLYYLVRFRRKD